MPLGGFVSNLRSVVTCPRRRCSTTYRQRPVVVLGLWTTTLVVLKRRGTIAVPPLIQPTLRPYGPTICFVVDCFGNICRPTPPSDRGGNVISIIVCSNTNTSRLWTNVLSVAFEHQTVTTWRIVAVGTNFVWGVRSPRFHLNNQIL